MVRQRIIPSGRAKWHRRIASDEEPWGWDICTYEEVNLIQHVQAGGAGLDG